MREHIPAELAEEYLKKQGYHIVDRDYKDKNADFDFIAIDQNTLVCVALAIRFSHQFHLPVEPIHDHAIKALLKTAQFYKNTHQGLPQNIRIDRITVDLHPDGKLLHLDHQKNIGQY